MFEFRRHPILWGIVLVLGVYMLFTAPAELGSWVHGAGHAAVHGIRSLKTAVQSATGG